MTTALDTIRYHSGIAGEEVADMVDSLEQEVSTLREQVEGWKPLHESLTKLNEAQERRHEKQVEKLTKERDESRKWAGAQAKLINKQEQQLAALAEQNEKMRKVLLRLACLGNGDQYGNSIGNCIAQEALSLSLPEEENEAIIAAANALENIASTSSSTRIRRVANDALTAIRARRKA